MQAGERTRGGRHVSARRRRRWPAAVLVVALLVAGGTTAFGLTRGEAAPSCAADRVPLRIATSPGLLDVLGRQAALFDAGTASMVGGRCTRTSVDAVAPSRFGDALLAQLADPGSSTTPQVWAPDAAAWATVEARRPELDAVLPHVYPVVASTPVVLAVPRPMATALGWPARQPSWTELAALARDGRGWSRFGHPEWGPVTVAWSDALTTTAGLGATLALYDRASSQAAGVDDIRRSMLTVQSGLRALAVDPSKALKPLRNRGLTSADALRATPLFPWTEQQVLRFNADDPQIPLVALYPRGGTITAEVPLLTLDVPSVTDAQRQAVDRFATFLARPAASAALAAAGWRSPRLESSATVAQGAIAAEPAYTPPAPERSTVARALQTWTALDRQGAVLVLLDVSGSMDEKVPAVGETRLQLAQQAISESLPLFSDRTSVGLWTFSRSPAGTRDWEAVVPLGRLSRTVGSSTARDALRDAVERLQAKGDTGLYDSTLAAVRAVQSGWRPGTDVVPGGERRPQRRPRQHLARHPHGSAALGRRPATSGAGADHRARARGRRPGDAADRRGHRRPRVHGPQPRGPRVGVPHGPHRMSPASPEWFEALPDVVTGLAQRWRLELGPRFEGGTASWVALARDERGDDLVLKVGWRHWEADHEAEGLHAWAGRGTVLLRDSWADEQTSALLLERCRPGDELALRPAPEQDEVIAVLLQRLWVEPPAGHPFRPLAQMCARWADEPPPPGGRPLDPGLVRAGLELFRSLPLEPGPSVLLATDLHAHNVLRAQREPWLVVDPKPWVGDPAYDPLQHLLNDPERMTRDPGGFADRLADLCGLDRERLRQWLFARCVVETRGGEDWVAEAARALAP
ncbi:hypothetical protein GCM10027446_29090 [Angustibacter peucedani]